MKQIRYPYVNNPFGFKLPEPKPIIHPIINKWDDFSEEDKIILSNIKKIISSDIGDCKVSIFGSRIKGYWDDKSDYDIIIHKTLSQEILYKLKNINYGVKVDINFYPDELFPIGSYIEIP